MEDLTPKLRKKLLFKINGEEIFLSATSGLVITEKKVYVVADNDLKLGIIDLKSGNATLETVLPGVLPVDEKERKKQKPDFESLFQVSDQSLVDSGLVAFSSGSTTQRFTAVFIPIREDGGVEAKDIVKFSLKPLFDPLIEKYGKINIEGAMIDGEHLVLVHRGNATGDTNRLFRFYKSDLLHLIVGGKISEKLEPVQSFEIYVGELDGVKLTITDISQFEGRIFFVAAAEDTANAVDDGKVKGTVFGELLAHGSVKKLGRISEQKAEGLSLRRLGHKFLMSVVTDNDDPHQPSELLEFEINSLD